jgi:hypothetical protein
MGDIREAFSAKTTIGKGFFKVTYYIKATEEKKQECSASELFMKLFLALSKCSYNFNCKSGRKKN